MWAKIRRQLARFPSAVLTSVGSDGFPYSLRCTLQTEPDLQLLRIEISRESPIQPGPASILCHRHNDKLWGMKSFLIRGHLERDGGSWLFTPDRFIPGMSAPWTMASGLLRARRRANRQLARSDQTKPKIDWAAVHALRRQARR